RSPIISLSILKNETRLLLPAPFAPISTFSMRNSRSISLMDLKPLSMTRFNMAMICAPAHSPRVDSSPGFALNLLEIDPMWLSCGRNTLQHRGDQGFWILRGDQESEVLAAEEPFGDGVVEQCEQGVEVASDVEDPDRLLVEFQRGPAQSLEEFLVGPDPAGHRE